MKSLIYLESFIIGIAVAWMFVPKDIEKLQTLWKAQSEKKKGVLLWIAPFLSEWGKVVEGIRFPALQRFMQKIARSLVMAGVEEAMTPAEFVALQAMVPALILAVMLIGSFRIEFLHFMQTPGGFILGLFSTCLIGSYLPVAILQDQVSKRQKSISRELPFALDMLTSAVQAGLDFAGAIRRLIKKTNKTSPLMDEFTLMLKEINLGKTRTEALKRMAERVGLAELNSVVSALVQADQLGTGLGTTLTNLSDDLRVKRFQKAEKMALEAPVKMLFPLIFFIFPSVFIILIGPLILQMGQELAKR
ncbi:MAG: type II secretion system F family protein [Candidatus Aureabacteria bacterium]|nr:type II secretion system F family protein [Candidatus Auribacterota bacterium]